MQPDLPGIRDLRPVIRVAAAVIVDENGRMLLVRKRDTEMFMNPGGKFQPGESPAEALVRELAEELGMIVEPAQCEYLGRFSTDAANEAGHGLDAELFRVKSSGPVAVAAEIEELAWIHPDDMPWMPIAPLVRDHAVRYL